MSCVQKEISPRDRALKAWETRRKNGKTTPWNKDLKGGICSSIAKKSWDTKRENGTGIPWNKNKKGSQVGWCLGLTKETNDGVALISQKLIGNKNCLGREVSKETKDILKNKAIAQWKDLNKREKLVKGIRKTILSGDYTPQNNAFKNTGFRPDLNNFFRSGWEANFARILNYNKIDWEYEYKRFDLIDSIYCPDFYLPEFECYIEVQGYVREKKNKNLKKMVEQYPEIKLFILDAEGYSQLENKFSLVVQNWENGGTKK